MMKRRKLFTVLTACAILFAAGGNIRRAVPQSASAVTASAADYASDTLAEYAREVAAIVNRERAAYGLAPLKYSEQLCGAALVRAQEIQIRFSHTRPNGSSCFTAMKEAGISYSYAGENIAYGQRSPEAVMDGWMHSEGHRANILNNQVEYIGIGVTQRNGVYYWSQFFAASNVLTGNVISPDTPAQTNAPAATTAAPAATTHRTTAATTTITAASTTVPTDAADDLPTATTAVPQSPQSPSWSVPNLCGGISSETLNNMLQKISKLFGLELHARMQS